MGQWVYAHSSIVLVLLPMVSTICLIIMRWQRAKLNRGEKVNRVPAVFVLLCTLVCDGYCLGVMASHR